MMKVICVRSGRCYIIGLCSFTISAIGHTLRQLRDSWLTQQVSPQKKNGWCNVVRAVRIQGTQTNTTEFCSTVISKIFFFSKNVVDESRTDLSLTIQPSVSIKYTVGCIFCCTSLHIFIITCQTLFYRTFVLLRSQWVQVLSFITKKQKVLLLNWHHS